MIIRRSTNFAVRDRLMTGGDPVRLQYMQPRPQSEFVGYPTVIQVPLLIISKLELAWHGARDADNKSRMH